MKYYYLYSLEYYDEGSKALKKGYYISDMFDDLELCLNKMRYADITKQYPYIKKIRYKRVYSAIGKFFDL